MPTHRDLPPEETHRSRTGQRTVQKELAERVAHARSWVRNNPQYAIAITVALIALLVLAL